MNSRDFIFLEKDFYTVMWTELKLAVKIVVE